MAQFQDDSRERERAIEQVRQQLQQASDRREASQLAILAATGTIAQLKLQEESLEEAMQECLSRRDAAASQRATVADELTEIRRRSLNLRDKEHQLSLSAEQVRHERKTLADRLRDDYRIELAELENEPSPEEASERSAVEEEIESLPARSIKSARSTSMRSTSSMIWKNASLRSRRSTKICRMQAVAGANHPQDHATAGGYSWKRSKRSA